MIVDMDQYIKEIYERNIEMMYKICFIFYKGNKSDIEDTIQSVFLKVIEKKIIFENLEHEKAWLIVSTNNYCKNKIKHWWNKNQELDFDIKEETKNDEIINKVLALPDKLKTPIYMYYYEGYSCVEISKILNINENTIYSYLHQGRKILKLMIEEENNE